MNRFFILFLFLFSSALFAQDRPVFQRDNSDINNPRFQDTLNRGGRSTSNRNIKNLDAKIEDYKIINFENDTTVVDTSLTIQKEYLFNYLRKDEFDLLPFSNMGQTYNTLSVDFEDKRLIPRFGARARHFNYMEVEDINYYYVPTPFTDLMFRSAFEQGQVLDAMFTANTTPNFNFSVAYKGNRSLGKYQHILTSTGNLRFTTNFKSKNDRYKAMAHFVAQDLLNQENGGLKDEDLINFQSGNPEFLDRGVFDPRFEDAESLLEGKRVYLDHGYSLIQAKDSTKRSELRIGNKIIFSDKYFEYVQNSPNDFFGEAFTSTIHERTTLEDFYAEANARLSNPTLGVLVARIGYNDFNYGYDQLVQVNGELITNRIKGSVISAGGSYKKNFGKLKLKGDFGINVSGDLDGNYFDGNLVYIYGDNFQIGGGINLNSRAPNYNLLLNQSDYINYNWQNDFKNVESRQLRFDLKSKKWVDVEMDFTNVENYAYFGTDSTKVVRPFQTENTINYFRIKLEKEFSFGKFHLNNTIRFQKVTDGEGVFNVPEFITRNTFYYANSFFKGDALYLQTGITLKYFSSYNMNAYDPVLAEFYVQNDMELGGFPLMDFFINARVRQTRIFLKAEHFNSSFTGYDYYSAPNYPYRDFVVRFGLVWNFFL